MARTATAAQKEVETLIDNTDDNYPLVLTIAATNSPDQLPGGAMTQSQAREHIRGVQRQGFKILTSDVIQAGDVNGIFTLQVWVLLVRQ